MASGMTNKGRAHILGIPFRNATEKTNYYVVLVTSAQAPHVDVNTLSDLTEIAAGNGYTTGGYQLTPNTTDFDVLTEDDTLNKGLVQIKDVTWNASGGTIPASGSGARWAVLTDDNGTIASREVYVWWDLISDRSVSSGQFMTLADLQIDITT